MLWGLARLALGVLICLELLMLLYHNSAVDEIAKNYNKVYASDKSHFSHRVTFEALDHFFSSVGGFHPTSCIDIGCGQGQVLSRIVDLADPEDKTRFVGVDISAVAIRQSDETRPDLSWAVDTYQNFIRNEAFSRIWPRGVDLIVNKGGFTSVWSEQEYEETMHNTKDAISPDGFFLMIKNIGFYKKWAHSRARTWDRDPLEIVFDCFGEPIIYPNSGYYVYLFPKEASRQPKEPYPHLVEFQFADGSNCVRNVRYDMLTRKRVAAEIASHRDEEAPLVMSDMRLILGPDIRVAPRSLPDGAKMLDRPWRASKAFIERAPELCSVRTTRIVTGGSFQDWLIDPSTRQTVGDPDEFKIRLDWMLGFLRAHTEADILFLLGLPVIEGQEKNGLILHQEAAEPFGAVTRELTNRHHVRLCELGKELAFVRSAGEVRRALVELTDKVIREFCA